MSEAVSFFAIYSKNLQATHMKDKLNNLVLPPLTALLGNPVQNNLFALIKKIFLQNWKFVSISLNFMDLGPPYNQMKISHMRCCRLSPYISVCSSFCFIFVSLLFIFFFSFFLSRSFLICQKQFILVQSRSSYQTRNLFCYRLTIKFWFGVDSLS